MKYTIYKTFGVIIGIILLTIVVLFMSGCNRQIADFNHHFDYAYISLPNGECIEGKVDSWLDFEDGDQLQVKINGITYLTDTTRCVLVDK